MTRSLSSELMVPSGPLLTNRMREILTHGSVGSGASNPAPYPALDAPIARLFAFGCLWRRATERRRWTILHESLPVDVYKV